MPAGAAVTPRPALPAPPGRPPPLDQQASDDDGETGEGGQRQFYWSVLLLPGGRVPSARDARQ